LRSSTWQVRRCWQTLSLRPSGELKSANLWRKLDLDRITGRTWISFLSDCVFGFTLYVWVLFGFGIWNLEEDLSFSFVSLGLFYFVWKALGQRGSVDYGCGPAAYGPHWPRLPQPASPVPTGLACPYQSRLPPSASLAPVGLACPHGEEEGSALVLGIGLRPWQSALGFPSLSFIYKSIVFLLFG